MERIFFSRNNYDLIFTILQKKIMFERNNQLALFSIIYFNKIKQNVTIDEK